MITDISLIIAALIPIALVPGYIILRASDIKFRSFYELLTFSFISGLFIVNLLYFFFRFFSNTEFFFLLPLVVAELAGIFYLWKTNKLNFEAFRITAEDFKYLGLPWIFVTIFLLSLFLRGTFSGIQYEPDGGLKLTHGVYSDLFWYPGVAAHLKNVFPPQLQIFAGYRLKYHYFSSLIIAHLNIITHLEIIKIYFQYIPFVLIPVLSAVLVYVLKPFLKNPIYVLSAFFVFFLQPDADTFYKNPNEIMAFILVLISFYFIVRWAQNKEDCIMLYCMGFSLSMVIMYEAFSAIILLPVAVLTGVFVYVTEKKKNFLIVSLITLVAAFALYSLACGIGHGAGHRGAFLNFEMPFFKHSMITYKVYLKWLKEHSLFYGHRGFLHVLYSVERFLQKVFFLFIHYIDTLGIGVLGLPVIVTLFRNLKKVTADNFFFSILIIICIVFPTFIGLRHQPFLTMRTLALGVPLLAIYAGVTTVALLQGNLVKKIFAVICLFVFVLFPMGKLQLAMCKADVNQSYYAWISPDQIKAFHFIREKTPPNAVVMHPYIDDPIFGKQGLDHPAWIFADHYYYMSALGERVALSEGAFPVAELKTSAKQDEIKKRRDDIAAFYNTEDYNRALDILSKYPVDYIWVDLKKPLKFNVPEKIKKVFEDNQVIIYQSPSRK